MQLVRGLILSFGFVWSLPRFLMQKCVAVSNQRILEVSANTKRLECVHHIPPPPNYISRRSAGHRGFIYMALYFLRPDRR